MKEQQNLTVQKDLMFHFNLMFQVLKSDWILSFLKMLDFLFFFFHFICLFYFVKGAVSLQLYFCVLTAYLCVDISAVCLFTCNFSVIVLKDKSHTVQCVWVFWQCVSQHSFTLMFLKKKGFIFFFLRMFTVEDWKPFLLKMAVQIRNKTNLHCHSR